MMLTLDEILDFFSRNQIPVLPCFGIKDGECTCRKGSKCPSPGKHPLMPKWQMLATTDKSKILAWIGKGKKPINLAIATGRFNPKNGKYLACTDLDLVDHPMKARLERHSRTVTQRSGGGGDHALYWTALPIRNSCQLVEEKMDIRGHGGILVVAPSLHKSGNLYEFTCDLRTTEIQELPDFLEKKLRIAIAEKNKKEKKPTSSAPKTKGELPELTKFWAKKTVDEIRVKLANKDLIPLGVRNTTMHRLLSSDRARGVPSKAALMAKARGYLEGFQDPETFEEELEAIVKSVMKYPTYNNSHEKVNELYLGWLGKNGYKTEFDLETLEEFDKRFFATLEPGSDIDDSVPLCHISKMREEFLKANGITKFATYRPQLLAKKLTALGIKRRRTSKGNGWAVRLRENPVQTEAPVCNNNRMECLKMADELKDEEKKKGLKDGDIIDYHGRKVRVELLKTQAKVKAHSREHLYQGRTGYDYNKALLALVPRLDEQMVDLMEKGELVMDREKTLAWLSQVKRGDVIGVKCHRYQVTDGCELEPWESLPVNKVVPVERKPGEFKQLDPDHPVEFLLMGEIDHARELGLLDILWRDGKPFGEDEFKDMTVVLLHDLDEDPAKSPGKGKRQKKK
jgi:hypothetical protein